MSSIAVFQENGLVTVFNAVIDGIEQLAVDARELHKFLKVGRDFSNWIKGRIQEYKFALNLDFISFRQIGRKPKGGRPTTEYHLTLDMAKELAMVENNEQGRKVRRYFIQCERNSHKTTSEQRKILTAACTKLSVSNKKISDVYTEVANHFGYEKAVDLPVDLLPAATAYVYEQLLARKSDNQQFDPVFANNVYVCANQIQFCNEWYLHIAPAIKRLNPELHAKACDHFASATMMGRAVLSHLDKQLPPERLTEYRHRLAYC